MFVLLFPRLNATGIKYYIYMYYRPTNLPNPKKRISKGKLPIAIIPRIFSLKRAVECECCQNGFYSKCSELSTEICKVAYNSENIIFICNAGATLQQGVSFWINNFSKVEKMIFILKKYLK